MLDDEDGVAEIAQPEGVEQAVVVALMEPDGRLVQDVEHADEARADLGGEPDALRFTAGQGVRGAAQREIVEADRGEEAEPLAHLLETRRAMALASVRS